MKTLLSDAIEDYERFRRSQAIKPTTLSSHRSVLKRFLTVNGNIYCDKINQTHVVRHLEEAAKTRQPQTLRIDHDALSVFFDWCRHTKRMARDEDPFYGMRRPRGVERERERLSVHEFPALLEAAGERCARDRIAVAILLYTLLRDQEVADLRVRDVDLEGGWLRARIHKSGIEDRMPISEELDYELRLWLTAYTTEVGHLHPNYRLVPARKVGLKFDDYKRFTPGGEVTLVPEKSVGKMGRIVNPILGAVGFPIVDLDGNPASEGAHTVRRSGARALFDTLVAMEADERQADPLRVVQSLLHHKSATVTERYIGLRADRLSRDSLLRGRKMYHTTGNGNVTPLHRESVSH